MLILTRNDRESIIIGKDIKVKVMWTHNGKVSLGIEAPRDISVHREEVWQRLKNEL